MKQPFYSVNFRYNRYKHLSKFLCSKVKILHGKKALIILRPPSPKSLAQLS